MTTTLEIPLSADPQFFTIALGDTEYRLTVLYRDAADAGWTVDIATVDGAPVVNGIPLVTGTDLLGQYGHLGIPGSLTVQSDAVADAEPTWENLGTGSHLYFTTAD